MKIWGQLLVSSIATIAENAWHFCGEKNYKILPGHCSKITQKAQNKCYLSY